MIKILTHVSIVTAFALTALSGQSFAQSFDASAIKVEEVLASRLPEKIKAAGVLTIGSDTAYAPWEFLSEKDGQTPEGIDVDIANAIGKKLGVKIDFQTSAFEAILPALGTKFDIGVSAFSITNERMKAVNFVSYADTGSMWAVKAGNPTKFDPADICGRKIAIQSGSYHEKAVIAENDLCKQAGKAEIEILPFSKQPEALTRVAAGGADATVSGEAGIGYAAKQSSGAFETLKPAGGALSKHGPNGIAVAKADMELTQLIADTINSLIADGTYKALLDTWGVGSVIVDKALVNPEVKI
ncbi:MULTISPECIES: ABC transporter substrate-binding protein [unclassified Shinella]|uniref:ABC transporter substrate-binding protein n=1 Tax=unclassified Shinella TaxID=2643062 RepID=UPI00225D2F7B|nr:MULTISPECIES: ABC transporter substrate-binding protein [unclassified Shinella]MCO5136436.1 ABC transporter substrate-binding protein [Shinella sp.]MDC7253887.1 ABC transporter substrate-binding protein [Shinella sp. YE25]CAI0336539.1 ABC transporter substrate-binding protein [Rhizobiaceae bacterium]CAK7255073.1 polar amino acid transport system substrate-binding protein [Shinella sp. WSC3-e]